MSRKSIPAYDSISVVMLEMMLAMDVIKASCFDRLASWRAVDARLTTMVEDGILERYIPTKGRKTVLYRFTDRGYASARLLHLYHGVYEGNLDMEDGDFVEKLEAFVSEVRIRRIREDD